MKYSEHLLGVKGTFESPFKSMDDFPLGRSGMKEQSFHTRIQMTQSVRVKFQGVVYQTTYVQYFLF